MGGAQAETVFVLTGNNTHTGGVQVAGNAAQGTAILEIDSDARLGAATGVLDLGRANGAFNLPGTLRATGNLAIAATRSTSFRDMTVDTNGFDVLTSLAARGVAVHWRERVGSRGATPLAATRSLRSLRGGRRREAAVAPTGDGVGSPERK